MRRILDNVIVRLVVYYAAVWSAYAVLLRAFPSLDEAIVRERGRVVTKAAIDIANPSALATLAVPVTDPDRARLDRARADRRVARRISGRAHISVDDTRPRPTVRTLAVRWSCCRSPSRWPCSSSRTASRSRSAWPASRRSCVGAPRCARRWTACIMFVMIGVGLSAGVQLLVVALVASIVFNVAILALNRNRFASRPRRVQGWTLAAAADIQTVTRRVVGLQIDAPTRSGSRNASRRCCPVREGVAQGRHIGAAERPRAARISNHVEKEVVTGSTGEHDCATRAFPR